MKKKEVPDAADAVRSAFRRLKEIEAKAEESRLKDRAWTALRMDVEAVGPHGMAEPVGRAVIIRREQTGSAPWWCIYAGMDKRLHPDFSGLEPDGGVTYASAGKPDAFGPDGKPLPWMEPDDWERFSWAGWDTAHQDMEGMSLNDAKASLEAELERVKCGLSGIVLRLAPAAARTAAPEPSVEPVELIAERRRRTAAKCLGMLRSRRSEATPELCLEGVKADSSLLGMVPDGLKTEEMCLLAVEDNPWMIQDVPETLMTEEICLAAVSSRGGLLEFIPESRRTHAVCAAALEEDMAAIEWVPDRFKTAELCADALWACAEWGSEGNVPDGVAKEMLDGVWRQVPDRLRKRTEEILRERGFEDLIPEAESGVPSPRS